jgi:hypothetical protein
MKEDFEQVFLGPKLGYNSTDHFFFCHENITKLYFSTYMFGMRQSIGCH